VAPVDLGRASDQAPASAESRLVYFDYDSFVVKPEFQSVIAAHARFLRAQPARKVAIEGHTDERGGREYNLALGQKRAEAVRNALSLLGVSSNQMEAVSFGKEKPAVTGSDETAFAKNRRAEIRYP
jgi:peptidoglycan-associated lipoprotein